MPARTIGLTGGIGSGKSTVARLLQDFGAHVIDTDAIAHRLTAPGGAAMAAIATRFGAEMVATDGSLDRGRMRERVFADSAAKQALEAILHPLIAVATDAAAQAAPRDAPLVFDVPLLTEAGTRWRNRVDRVLVVDCSEATQVERVMRRNGWTRDAVLRVIEQQASRAERRAIADAVILNDGISMDTLRDAVHAVWRQWFSTSNTGSDDSHPLD